MDEKDGVRERFNLASYLLDGAIRKGWSDRAAYLIGEETVTYARLLREANRAGNALRDLGARWEERMVMLLPDGIEFVAAFLGAAKIGLIPVPVNPLLRPHELEVLFNDSRARFAVFHETFRESLETLRGKCPFLEVRLRVGEGPGEPDPEEVSWSDAVSRASDRLDAVPTGPDDVLLWAYSSGSTGLPKAAVHTHANVLAASERFPATMLGLKPGDVCYAIPKLFFTFGLGAGMYIPLRWGAATVLDPERPRPGRAFEIIDRCKPRVFYSVPSMYARMLQEKRAEERYDTSSLEITIAGGEPLPPAIFHAWRRRFGTEILEGIGSSEMLHFYLVNRPGRVRPGSCGEAVDGYELRVVDESLRELPDGEVGSLMIKGPTRALYYWRRKRQTERTMIGEWLLSGDKFRRDADGYYAFCGRSDDMLKVGGVWVSPAEVERAVAGHPAVLECAVVGAPDENDLVKPKAFVVLTSPLRASPELAEEIKAFVKEAIAPFKRPRWIEFVDSLPKTATGKIRRFRLREAARRLTPPA